VTDDFNLVAALAGGALLGAGLVLILVGSMRVVGVWGVVGGLVSPRPGDRGWRLAFVFGLIAGGAALAVLVPQAVAFRVERSWPVLAGAGLLVGYGSRLANGCTSGHGVCGLGRCSLRSIVATAVFVASGAGTVFMINHLQGVRL
jgi:uncharacterized protein